MTKTPTCDRWKFETDTGAEVVPVDIAEALEIELERARAEIDKLETIAGEQRKAYFERGHIMQSQADELIERDKLIEQMREALNKIKAEIRSAHRKADTALVVKIEGVLLGVDAALEAAERNNNE